MSIIESEFRSVILSGFILSTPFIFASDNSAFILSFIPDSSMSFCSAFVFTFHNVSINTISPSGYGLIDFFFTFHNVSINTTLIKILKLGQEYFTFHNVSINTMCVRCSRKLLQTLHSTMFLLIRIDTPGRKNCDFLYIPQCFY